MSDMEEGQGQQLGANAAAEEGQQGDIGAVMRAAENQAVEHLNPTNADIARMLGSVSQQLAELQQRTGPIAGHVAADLAAAAAAAARPVPPADFDVKQAAFDHDRLLASLVPRFEAVAEVVGHYFREHLSNAARDRSAGPGAAG